MLKTNTLERVRWIYDTYESHVNINCESCGNTSKFESKSFEGLLSKICQVLDLPEDLDDVNDGRCQSRSVRTQSERQVRLLKHYFEKIASGRICDDCFQREIDGLIKNKQWNICNVQVEDPYRMQKALLDNYNELPDYIRESVKFQIDIFVWSWVFDHELFHKLETPNISFIERSGNKFAYYLSKNLYTGDPEQMIRGQTLAAYWIETYKSIPPPKIIHDKNLKMYNFGFRLEDFWKSCISDETPECIRI